MNAIRDNIVSGLIGAILGGLGTLALSIYDDFLPALIPALTTVSPSTYIKLFALLILLFCLAAIVAVTALLKVRSNRPRVLSGRKFGFRWSAELDYSNKRSGVEIDLQWLCPKHGVHLGVKSAEIPETTYHTLWCHKCDKYYEMKSKGDSVHVEEAERLVRREILAGLRFE